MTQFMRVETTGGEKRLVNLDHILWINSAAEPGQATLYLVGDITLYVKADFNAMVRDLPCIKF